MTDEISPAQLLSGLRLPAQDLPRLSFCNSNKPAKVADWAGNLKATQITHTSIVLYKALPEIARLKTTYKPRWEMLESLRPRVQHCIEGLTRDFLNQPVILPQAAQKTAIVAQALQKQMLDGYLACLANCIGGKRFKSDVYRDLAHIIHRAITAAGLMFFRSFQLYTQPPAGMWQTLHALYRVADYYELSDTLVTDNLSGEQRSSTVSAAYTKVILLAACRPNQLNQKDLAQLFSALDNWAHAVRLKSNASSNRNNLFLVNLDRDAGPTYKSRFDGKSDDSLLEPDLENLLGHIAKLKPGSDQKASGGSGISVPADFTLNLLNHVLDAWGHVAQRKQERRPVQAAAEVCTGLTDCHYYIAGGISFADFTGEAAGGPLSDRGFGDYGGLTPNREYGGQAAKPRHNVSIVNASAGGYCLLWKNEMPSRIQAGELIAVKELGRLNWSLGVIRWVKQLKQASQLGVKILSQHPRATAVSQVYDMGGNSDFMRAISLVGNEDGKARHTLLTSSAPFTEGMKVRLLSGDQIVAVRLDSVVFTTASLRQFSYQKLDQPPEDAPAAGTSGRRPAQPDPFDASWDED